MCWRVNCRWDDEISQQQTERVTLPCENRSRQVRRLIFSSVSTCLVIDILAVIFLCLVCYVNHQPDEKTLAEARFF